MSWKSNEKYVVLQDFVPVAEQRAIAAAVVAVMPSEKPSQVFVDQLSRDLLAEARQRASTRRQGAGQAVRVLGWVGGGILSVITGVLIWLLVQRSHETHAPELTLSGA
ncbi:MAG: hypothetical protein MUF84_17315 [Anaerolineae bacterium]|jgi:hypothetical protein|nr:hypothetical protein [Anaerolineae bacterium]